MSVYLVGAVSVILVIGVRRYLNRRARIRQEALQTSPVVSVR